MNNLSTVRIVLEDLQLGFGEVTQKRYGGKEVTGTMINASLLPIRPDGMTLQDFIDRLEQIFGTSIDAFEGNLPPTTTTTVLPNEFILQGIYPYSNRTAYSKGSMFTLNGQVYVVILDIPIGTAPSSTNTKLLFEDKNIVYSPLEVYNKGFTVSSPLSMSYTAVDDPNNTITEEVPSLHIAKRDGILGVLPPSTSSSADWEEPYNSRYVEYWNPSILCIKDRVYFASNYKVYVCLQNCKGIDPILTTSAEYFTLLEDKQAELSPQPPAGGGGGEGATQSMGYGGYIGQIVYLPISYERIPLEYPNLIPMNGYTWYADEFPILFSYLERHNKLVDKAIWDGGAGGGGDWRVRVQKCGYDSQKNQVYTFDLRTNSPFPRMQGTRANLDLGQDDMVKSHSHQYSRQAPGNASREGDTGGRNGARNNNYQSWTTESTGGEENRPYSYTVSAAIIGRV